MYFYDIPGLAEELDISFQLSNSSGTPINMMYAYMYVTHELLHQK